MEHSQSNLGLDQCHDCGVRRKQVANPTTNYGFVLPTPTDLVTDLPADFDVALQGVDTRLKALQPGTTLGDIAYSSATANTNTRLPIGTNGQVLAVVAGVPAWQNGTTGDIEGVTAGVGITGGGTSGTVTVTNDMATTITAAGDIVVGTGSGTYDNLPIGTTNQVLTADTTVSPYKVKWAAPTSSGKSYSLINTGGTALTGAGTISVSSISGYDDLVIMVLGASSASASSNVYLRLNADSGNNYRFGGPMIIGGSGYDSNNFTTELGNTTSIIRLFKISTSATATGSGSARVSGCTTSGFKAFTAMGAGANDGGNSQRSYWYNGMYLGTSTISSVDITSDTGNFDAGTLYVYGAA
jgi:hypothetical protein